MAVGAPTEATRPLKARAAASSPPAAEAASSLSADEFASSPSAADACRAILLAAAKAVGASEPLSVAELLGMPRLLHDVERHRGWVSRVRGLFRLVNLLLALSILGVGVSCGPALWSLLRPCREWLARTWRVLLLHVLLPLAVRAHRWGIAEAAAWRVPTMVLADARVVFTPGTGTFVAGLALALAAGLGFWYSASRWLALLTAIGFTGEGDRLLVLFGWWLAACTAPTAVCYGSSLLGFVAFIAAAVALGLRASYMCGSFYIGFDRDSNMERVAMVTGSLLITYVLLAAADAAGNPMRAATARLQPFEVAATTFGAAVFYLSLLILAHGSDAPFRPDPERGAAWVYAARNGIAALAMALGIAAGYLLFIPGLANTAIVFSVLFALEKYVEHHLRWKWNVWVLVLVLSLVVFGCVLLLHEHPEAVKQLFLLSKATDAPGAKYSATE
jgi:hypothetical protein